MKAEARHDLLQDVGPVRQAREPALPVRLPEDDGAAARGQVLLPRVAGGQDLPPERRAGEIPRPRADEDPVSSAPRELPVRRYESQSELCRLVAPVLCQGPVQGPASAARPRLLRRHRRGPEASPGRVREFSLRGRERGLRGAVPDDPVPRFRLLDVDVQLVGRLAQRAAGQDRDRSPGGHPTRQCQAVSGFLLPELDPARHHAVHRGRLPILHVAAAMAATTATGPRAGPAGKSPQPGEVRETCARDIAAAMARRGVSRSSGLLEPSVYDLRKALTAVTRAGVPPKRYATSTASWISASEAPAPRARLAMVATPSGCERSASTIMVMRILYLAGMAPSFRTYSRWLR